MAEPSSACAMPSEVTASSPEERSTSTSSEISCFFDVLIRVWQGQSCAVGCARYAHDLVLDAALALAAAAAHHEEGIVVGIKIGGVDGVGQVELSGCVLGSHVGNW